MWTTTGSSGIRGHVYPPMLTGRSMIDVRVISAGSVDRVRTQLLKRVGILQQDVGIEQGYFLRGRQALLFAFREVLRKCTGSRHASTQGSSFSPARCTTSSRAVTDFHFLRRCRISGMFDAHSSAVQTDSYRRVLVVELRVIRLRGHDVGCRVAGNGVGINLRISNRAMDAFPSGKWKK